MANPNYTVGQLVQRMKNHGMSEDEIAREFENLYGAPHYNLPESTTLRQAHLQSTKAIKRRGAAQAKDYERIFFPVGGAGGRLDVPPEEYGGDAQPAFVPNVGEPEDQGVDEPEHGEEYQQILDDWRETRAAIKEAQSDVELRGGIVNPLESLKRAGGWFAGVGENIYEMTPWGEQHEQERLQREQEQETPAQAALRQRQESLEREVFTKNVLDNPNHTFADIVKSTPTAIKIQAQQKQFLQKYDVDGSFHGFMQALGQDAGNLIMFLPRLVMAPFEEFEAPKDKSSFEIGKGYGRELLPGMAVGVTMGLPGVDFVNQAKVAPLSTALMWIPILEGGAAALKALPGGAAVAGKVAQWSTRVGEGWRAVLATTADAVGQKIGKTSQFVMDAFYNKDPQITALMEEAFSEGRTQQEALNKLGDVISGRMGEALEAGATGEKPGAARRWGFDPTGAPAGPTTGRVAPPLDRPSHLASALYPNQLERAGLLQPGQAWSVDAAKQFLRRPGGPVLDAKQLAQMDRLLEFADDAMQVMQKAGYTAEEARKAVSSAMSQNRNVARVPFSKIIEWVNKNEPNEAVRAQFLGTLAEELKNAKGPYRLTDPTNGNALTSTWQNIGTGNAAAVADLAERLDTALAGSGKKPAFPFNAVDTKIAIQNAFAQIAEDVANKRLTDTILRADDMARVSGGSGFVNNGVFDAASASTALRSQLPNVLTMDANQFNVLRQYVTGLVAKDSSFKPLLQRLQEMTPLKDVASGKPVYVSKPLAYMQELTEQNSNFRKSLDSLTGKVNSVLQQGAIPLNPPSLISNITGNAIAASTKFGTMPFTELELVRAYLVDYESFLRGEAPSKTVLEKLGLGALSNMPPDVTRMRAYRAAQRTGVLKSGGVGMTADMGLAELLDPRNTGNLSKPALTAWRKALAGGGGLMQIGDQGAMLRTFTSKFGEMSGFLDELSKAEPGASVSFPTGPNTRGTVKVIGPGQLAFEEMTHGGLPGKPGQVITSTAITSTAQLDDIAAKAAGAMAGGLIFDYSRVPGYLAALKRQPLIGAGSPFYTYGYKALSAPPFKGGMLNFLMSSADGVSTNVPSINAQITANAMQLALRRAMLVAGAKATADDPETRKLYGGDPTSPGAIRVTGRGAEEAANVARFSSANWFEGTQSYLNIMEGIADSIEEGLGIDAVSRYAKIAVDPEAETKYSQKDRDLAYLAAISEVKRKGLNTPETLPTFMKLMGIGGTQAFETFAKIRQAQQLGESVDLGETFYNLVVPGGAKRLINIGNVIAGTETGLGLMSRGRPEDAEIDPKDWREKMKYAFVQATGLGSMPVDSMKTADRTEKAWKKEMADRLGVFKKDYTAKMYEKYKQQGLSNAQKKAANDAEILAEELQGLIDEAADDWRDQIETQLPGLRTPYTPPSEDATPTSETEEETIPYTPPP